MKNIPNIVLIFLVAATIFGCQKETEFLSPKPNISLVVPSRLEDYQNILYYEDLFNNIVNPGMGTLSTDEYYVTPASYANGLINERNVYIFKSGDIYESALNFSDWSIPYTQVYYANTVLEGIEKLTIASNQQLQYNNIKGQALFYRAYAFYNLAQTFAMPFDSSSYTTTLGIPLKLSSDFNVSVQRSTVQQTYDRIIADLTEALDLLPVSTSFPTQPSKAAGNALMARVNLAIRNYPKALQYANATLAIKSDLVDYNTINPQSTFLSTTYLKEDIYQASQSNFVLNGFSGGTMVDSVLYSFYDDPNDLRKSVCYKVNGGRVEFRGTYSVGGVGYYCGLAVDEIYLIRAECLARQGNVSGAMSDINTLLRNRWKKNNGVTTYVDQSASSIAGALGIILKERRKELPFRGLRWTDVRRLNLESGFQTTLTRMLNGTTYSLPPGDARFAMSIPASEIRLSGIAQNPR